MIDRCHDCGVSLGSMTQETLPGVEVEKRCPQCETNYRAKWMVKALPDEDEPAFDELSEWEKDFVASVKRQFQSKGTLSEKQFQIVSRIYEKI